MKCRTGEAWDDPPANSAPYADRAVISCDSDTSLRAVGAGERQAVRRMRLCVTACTIMFLLAPDGSQQPVSSLDALKRHVESAFARPSGVVHLAQTEQSLRGFERLLYKSLGLRTDATGTSLVIHTSGPFATLTLLDEDWNESLAVNPAPSVTEPVRFVADAGDVFDVPPSHCFRKEEAAGVLEYFFENRTLPPDVAWGRQRGARRK